MTESLFQRLLERLDKQGVPPDDVSFLLRDLSKIFESTPEIGHEAATARMNLLGWNGLTLDYQSLQLAIAWIESENAKAIARQG